MIPVRWINRMLKMPAVSAAQGCPLVSTSKSAMSAWRIRFSATELRGSHAEDFRDLEQDDDIRSLNAALDETYERAVQPGSFCQLLLRQSLFLPCCPQNDPKRPLRPVGRLDLRPVFRRFSGSQVNILRFLP